MIKNKKRKKTFKNNPEYFKWYNDNKDKINIILIEPLKTKIKIEYENKEVE